MPGSSTKELIAAEWFPCYCGTLKSSATDQGNFNVLRTCISDSLRLKETSKCEKICTRVIQVREEMLGKNISIYIPVFSSASSRAVFH